MFLVGKIKVSGLLKAKLGLSRAFVIAFAIFTLGFVVLPYFLASLGLLTSGDVNWDDKSLISYQEETGK